MSSMYDNDGNHSEPPQERITSCSFCLLFYSVLQCLLIRFGSLKEESDSSNKQSDTLVMCGISGMFGLPDTSVIQRMVEILQHRGPDGNGIWSDSKIAFGHNRLSIVDLWVVVNQS